MSTFPEVDNVRAKTTAGVNFRFAVVTQKKILQMLTFPERVLLSPSSYMPIQSFSSILVNSGF